LVGSAELLPNRGYSLIHADMTITRTERQKIYEEGRIAASFGQSVVVSPYLHDDERQAIWLEGYRSNLR
jgi:ribosome modulation factor